MNMIELDGSALRISDLAKIAYENEKVQLSNRAVTAVKDSHTAVIELANSDKPIYGVNTGFGIFSDKRISRDQSIDLNRNLIFSHAVATGDPLPEPIVRAAMAIRVNALAKGASGVQFAVLETLIQMLNKGVTPLISSKGSLGSSGDLCLLAQLGLVILGTPDREESSTGHAYYKGTLMSGKKAMDLAGIEPVVFSYKDGLALINGATFTAAITALCLHAAYDLAMLADITAAMSLEALCGCSYAFHPGIHELRNMAGQQTSANHIINLTRDSSFVDSTHVLQDAYSVRCAPQVHGAVRDTLHHAKKVITAEINAATDNPLMVADGMVISGGNFHGEPIGLISDFMKIALSELGAISERRTFRLMDEKLNNGLPAMLVDPDTLTGLHSGVMILQYTAAALALENQTLASPDSVRSLPTSANQEDHNANSYNSALHLLEISGNLTKILAIELYCAARAIQIRKKIQPDLQLGCGTQKVFDIFQEKFNYSKHDAQWRHDLEKLYALLEENSKWKKELLSVVN